MKLTRLGTCYEDGIGTEKDYAKALHYYTLAADQDVVPALFFLGLFLPHSLLIRRPFT